MPNFKEFRFRLKGKIKGVEITPLTIPMSRLVEYLSDLAQLLGHNESVHFMSVGDGSAQPIIFIEAEEEGRVLHRVRNAKMGVADRNANIAYKRLDDRLREDEGSGEFYSASAAPTTEIIEFPGKNAVTYESIGPLREPASLVGELKRVGGMDDSVPVHLKRSDEEKYYCETTEAIAKQLAPLIYQTIRVHGMAYWARDEEGRWILTKFKIQSFDPEPLRGDSFSETLERLRKIPENGWSDVQDPLAELRRIRHGEDKPQ
jgi:hypothetical protein